MWCHALCYISLLLAAIQCTANTDLSGEDAVNGLNAPDLHRRCQVKESHFHNDSFEKKLRALDRRSGDDDKIYDQAKKRGEVYIQWLKDRSCVPPEFRESRFNAFDEPETWGWTRQMDDEDQEPEVPEALHGSVSGEKGEMVWWENDEDVQPRGQGTTVYHATWAYFKNIFWPDHGAISADDNASPQNLIPGLLEDEESDWYGKDDWQHTPLNKWSDVVFITWKQLCGDDAAKLQRLHLIVRSRITNTISKRVIVALMNKLKYADGKAPVWPGRRFVEGNEGFQALMGTPNVVGVIFLLLQHGDELGQKYVNALHVWNPDPALNHMSILVEIKPSGVGGVNRAEYHDPSANRQIADHLSRRRDYDAGFQKARLDVDNHGAARTQRLIRDEKEYERAKAKGASYLLWLKDPDCVPKEFRKSHWTKFEQLALWGWDRTETDFDMPHDAPLDGKVGSENGIQVQWRQDRDFTNPNTGTRLHGTEAIFENTFWPRHGVIVANVNESPQYRVKILKLAEDFEHEWEYTELKRWSDVVFLTWRWLCHPAGAATRQTVDMKNLKCIVRSQIANQETVVVVGHALRQYRGFKNGKAPIWPGKLFRPGDKGFSALVGTPNVLGIVFLLLQHQEELGPKSISGVIVYNDKKNTAYSLSMMVELRNRDGAGSIGSS